MRAAIAICTAADRLNEGIGRMASWLILGLVVLQFGVVLMRYVLGIASVYADESLVYVHSSLFLLLAGYTLLHDAHVRIDIFYQRFGDRLRALVNLAGCLLFLLPSVALIGWEAFPYVARSWATLEGSSTLGGLPIVFLLKSMILVFCFLVGVQGVSLALASLVALVRPASGPARGG